MFRLEFRVRWKVAWDAGMACTESLKSRHRRAIAMAGSAARWGGEVLLRLAFGALHVHKPRRKSIHPKPKVARPLGRRIREPKMPFMSPSRRKLLVDVSVILVPAATIAAPFISRPGEEPRDDVSVSVVAEDTQQISVVAEDMQQTKLEQIRTEGFRQRNGHCMEPTLPSFSFHATEGWTIDRASVEVRCHESSKSTCNGIRGITERSFNYSCTVANSGFCIPPLVRDGRGSCWGEIKWTEQRVTD